MYSLRELHGKVLINLIRLWTMWVVDDVGCHQYLGDRTNLIKKSLIIRVSILLIFGQRKFIKHARIKRKSHQVSPLILVFESTKMSSQSAHFSV